MFGYIYKTTNKINGRTYVGQHHGDFDPKYLGSGNNLRHAIAKYGVANMAVVLIATADGQEELDNLEIFHIKAARDSGEDLYNILPGGLGVKPEVSVRIGHALRGRPKSPEHRAKLLAWLQSPKFRAIASKTHKGKKLPEHVIKMHADRMRGTRLSEETRRKMSISQRERNSYRSPESNEKRRISKIETERKKREKLLAENKQLIINI